ncbi:hypothetical protein C5167_014169 [Papaver somniferum]|uniref:Uncharacterized protein n=1 Tax=Papaver somniferum TaxID=3469 RepID=A0A4Y7J5H4_PAPSO|nr:hypothetical protein C5167_014169 [Papaver somniferum]
MAENAAKIKGLNLLQQDATSVLEMNQLQVAIPVLQFMQIQIRNKFRMHLNKRRIYNLLTMGMNIKCIRLCIDQFLSKASGTTLRDNILGIFQQSRKIRKKTTMANYS